MPNANNNEISQQDALMQLMAPDGYYAYLGVERKLVENSNGTTSLTSASTVTQPTYTVDEDAVKKSYRKLSRKHHPDKGGDVNTFRLLNRAQRVLLHSKLRAQYDNLGIDLDDEEEDNKNDTVNSDAADTNETNSNKKDEGNGISQGIISELASTALSGIMQLAVRTIFMCVTAVVITRYRWTTYPALLYLAYVLLQVVIKASVQRGSVYDSGITIYDAASPALIMLGLIIMFVGRTREGEWTWTFWIGESLVLALFIYNSFQSVPWNAITLAGLGVVAGLLALWFRGNFYNYLTVTIIEVILAALVAMAFPIMELILEAILNEKLKKVGEKIRAHHRQLEDYYAEKYEQPKKKATR